MNKNSWLPIQTEQMAAVLNVFVAQWLRVVLIFWTVFPRFQAYSHWKYCGGL